MSTTRITPQASIDWAVDQTGAAFRAVVHAWPNHRHEAAESLLGCAVAICDTMGVDVEGFVAHLRDTHPKPNQLVPPRSS